MANRTLVTAALALAGIVAATQAPARAPAPLMPTALVEEVKSASADVEFMDYVGPGQVIRLAPRDVLVLSYLKSCAHETITGGTVKVGMDRSEVEGGKIVRAKVACHGGEMLLSAAQANTSGASAFRLQSADIQPTVYARSPVVQLPADLPAGSRVLRIERVDRKGERHEIKVEAAPAGTAFVDLARRDTRLARGGVYTASIEGRKLTFRIDRKARSGPAPVVSRLVRLQ